MKEEHEFEIKEQAKSNKKLLQNTDVTLDQQLLLSKDSAQQSQSCQSEDTKEILAKANPDDQEDEQFLLVD